MGPRASVVIPVYNRAQGVLATLQSVRDQTMTEFECLVVDDGSDDGKQLRAAVAALGDERFRYLRQQNAGASAARNAGIAKARGQFVAFLDSDDRWLQQKLALDLAAGAHERVVFSQVRVERRSRVRAIRPTRGPMHGERICEYLACRQGFIQTSTVALPLELARRVKFDEQIAFGQDTDFAIRLAAAGATFHMHPAPLVIMKDDESGERLSRRANWRPVLDWLNRVRPLLTSRAYLAYRGWHVARLAASAGCYRDAFGFYFAALSKGALPLPLAFKAVGQILIPRSVYGRLRR